MDDANVKRKQPELNFEYIFETTQILQNTCKTNPIRGPDIVRKFLRIRILDREVEKISWSTSKIKLSKVLFSLVYAF
jgi:hypothetical protein